MSSQDEDRRSLDENPETHDDVSTKPKISYSREFLLSISNSDICKKSPSGFDESLRIWGEELLILPDRTRIPGSLPYQGFRRNEYSSSPPTRGDTSTYSRGIYGKWDSRSSARSDRDINSQPDKDSDSGKRFGNQSRHSWQTPEHDGLLGSGSFPRPSGYAAGISAAKVRPNEQNQLSRSIEPYHPPRPYKAVPHSRKDTDAFNDETFGSIESTNEDRAEQERRRRASFEMMRKEHHKALQEKQNSNLRKNKVGDALSLCEGLVDNKEEKGLFARNNELEASAVSNDSEKSSLSSQAPASRPLVPPGFKTNPLEKSSGLKSLIHPSLSEVLKSVTSESTTDANPNLIQNANHGLDSRLSKEISVFGRQLTEKTQHTVLLNKGEHVNAHVSLDEPKQTVIENKLFRNGSPLQTHGTPDDPNFTKLNDDGLEEKNVYDSSISHSTSILEKFFGSTLSTKNDGDSNSVELHNNKLDDTWSPNTAHSSKFAQWFSEEEAKAAADVSSAGQKDSLSLIVGSDKAAANGISDQACSNNKVDAVPAVLTCEDLEQSILSKYGPKPTNTQPHLKSFITTEGGIAQSSGHADNHMSLHLLSVLQKSSDQTNTVVNPININLADKQVVSQENDRTTVVTEPKEEENSNLGKTLTLEALFGTAFMKELESVGAPVSVQRGSTSSARADAPGPHAFPFPVEDNDISSSTVENTGLQRPIHDYNASSNHRQIAKLSGADNWLGVGNSSIGISTPKRQTESLNVHGGFVRNAGYQLSEEENLISAGDTRDSRLLPVMLVGNSINSVAEKLAVLGGIIKDKHSMGGSEGTPFPHGSHEQRGPDISYSNLQLQQQSSQHFQPPHNTRPRPLYHHLESHPAHMSSHLKFMSPEQTFGHDSPVNRQPSSPIIWPPSHHNPNVRASGCDVLPPQHPMLHQMQMTGSHPQFGRGGPVPHHGNQPTGFIQEMNQTQGLPFGSRLPNIGGSGVPMPGRTPPEVNRNEAPSKFEADSPFCPFWSQPRNIQP